MAKPVEERAGSPNQFRIRVRAPDGTELIHDVATSTGRTAEGASGPVSSSKQSYRLRAKTADDQELVSAVLELAPRQQHPLAGIAPRPPPVTEIIKVAEPIAPPRISELEAASAAVEKQWFNRLQKITTKDLQPGDILLKKDYSGGSIVAKAQKIYPAHKASPYTCHAMIFIGDGKIAHAYEVPMAVGLSGPEDCDQLVYRPVKKKDGENAAAAAKWMAESGKMNYSVEDCLSCNPFDSFWGEHAKGRADLIAAKKLPTERTMCSEFVTYCYQSEKDRPLVELDAKHVPPIRLEEYLNDNPELFRFAGAIARVSMSKDPGVSMKKVFANVVGELEENAKLSPGSAPAAAKKVAEVVEKEAESVKADASAAKEYFEKKLSLKKRK